MSDIWNKDLITSVESVDLAFTSIWSKQINLECATLFLNTDLRNDFFFNKLTNMSCTSEVMIEEALALFKKYDTIPYVYTLNSPSLDDDLLRKKGFTFYDSQHVLLKSPNNTIQSSARKILESDSILWSKTFCSAYDCNEWISHVDKIVKNSNPIEYYVDETISACMALLEKNSMLGLYCLGTIPAMRNQSIAARLIEFALNEVKRRDLDFLMLETYKRDNLLNFYSKLGFKELYQKKIYTI